LDVGVEEVCLLEIAFSEGYTYMLPLLVSMGAVWQGTPSSIQHAEKPLHLLVVRLIEQRNVLRWGFT
jgi:hypothetical protein